MEHVIVIEQVEGQTEGYAGYKSTICEIPVDQNSETGWPDAVAKTKKVLEGYKLAHELRTKNLAGSPNTHTNSDDYVTWKCYSKKVEPLNFDEEY